MSTAALILNLLVSGLASGSFYRAGHFSWRLSWPFVVGSIPAAFLGGFVKVSASFYTIFLSAALIFAAFRLILTMTGGVHEKQERAMPPIVAGFIGAAIGLFSGIVGIGGGIILSPLLLLGRFAKAKEVAATSAVFILLNSFSSLLGRFLRTGLADSVPPLLYWTLFVCFAGGVLGSQAGARHFTSLGLRRVLAMVLFFASAKLLFQFVAN